MAADTLKSTTITGLDSLPILRPNAWVHGGNVRAFSEYVTASAAADNTSTYRFFRVHSWMRPVNLSIFSVAQGGSAAVGVGLYDTAANGGAVVNATLFASAFSLVSAVAGTNVTYQNLTYDKSTLRIWELLGLTTDPSKEYDVTIKVSATLTNGGLIALHGTFAV
jgi:hypothetical protein